VKINALLLLLLLYRAVYLDHGSNVFLNSFLAKLTGSAPRAFVVVVVVSAVPYKTGTARGVLRFFPSFISYRRFHSYSFCPFRFCRRVYLTHRRPAVTLLLLLFSVLLFSYLITSRRGGGGVTTTVIDCGFHSVGNSPGHPLYSNFGPWHPTRVPAAPVVVKR